MTSLEEKNASVAVKGELAQPASANTTVSPQPTTIEAIGVTAVVRSRREKRLLLKLDFVVLPMLTCSWLIAYLDRNSFGNARIMHFQGDLALTDKQFFNCLSMFFVGYVAFLLPANLGLRIVGPPLQIGVGVILFGICTACVAIAKSYSAIAGLRVLIGIAEAFVQAGSLYSSVWWKRDEIATRGGCFSGLFAYSVDKDLRGTRGLHSWQWLFIVEGIPAVAFGLVLIFFLPPFPETVSKKKTWLFTQEEADLAVQRSIEGNNKPNAKVMPRQILVGLKDPKAYLTALIYGSVGLGLASVSSFLPTFIREFGFGRLQTQLLSMIPYVTATFTLVLVCPYSDRVNRKGPAVFLCLATTASGYIILMIARNKIALTVGTCLVTSGLYPTVVLVSTWIFINHGGYTKRSTAWAMAQVTGQCCGIIGTQVYRHPPRFLTGHGVLLGFTVTAMFATVANYLWLSRKNRKKKETADKWRMKGLEDPDRAKTFEELFDYHPDFKYIL